MSRETLRDRHMNVLGYVETNCNGKLVLYDRANRVLGYYDPNNNTTTDYRNLIVGYGNLLAYLLK